MRPMMALTAAVLGLALTTGSTQAADTSPQPTPKPKSVDCSKSANKNNPACKKFRDDSHDDAIYSTAYWLAKSGKFAEARAVLAGARNPSDPRILNYMGFTTRKLGNVDEAMGYYARALAINPNYTVARAYMGEAFLQKGEIGKAREQLAEIAARCGASCSEHAELAAEITKFEAGLGRGGQAGRG